MLWKLGFHGWDNRFFQTAQVLPWNVSFFLVYSMVVSGSPNRWDRWCITNQLAVYTTYSPCQLGDYISPTTYQGNQETPLIKKNGIFHWTMILRSEEHTLEILQMDAMRVWNRYSISFQRVPMFRSSIMLKFMVGCWMHRFMQQNLPFQLNKTLTSLFFIAVNCLVRTTPTLLRSFARHLVGKKRSSIAHHNSHSPSQSQKWIIFFERKKSWLGGVFFPPSWGRCWSK